ncbi:serine hydrolase domain-containing protein [Neobacillus sp. Marseille-QA0830]
MKKRAMIFTAVCTAVIGTTNVQASEGTKSSPNMEVKEKKSVSALKNPHSEMIWSAFSIPVASVLKPSSPREAKMIASPLQQIDSIINNSISQQYFPGAVALVARSGKIVKHTAYGYSARYTDSKLSEMDRPISMRKDTIFDVASISKIFTTVAIMQLYEKGLFQLDDPVSKYIPAFAANGKEKVTIRQLLTHTSGLKAWLPLYSLEGSREEKLRLVFQQPLINKPGASYEYSDLNMITIGALIEQLSGRRQDVFVKEHITRPLGMKDTMYNPPASLKKRIAATEYQAVPARGLVWGKVHDENAWSLGGVAGHAGVFSTAQDLAKLAHVFINNGKYGGKTILKPETVKFILQNQNGSFRGDDHGLGWELAQNWYMDALSEGTASFGHTGFTGTSIVVNPNSKTVAILLTNRVHPSRSMGPVNETRRLFARQVADALPVSIPGGGTAWFAGYGDKVNRKMEADLHLKKDGTLSFSTWHIMEDGWDFGYIEIFRTGTWKKAAEFAGTSNGWEKQQLPVPKDAEKLRFVYKTDGSINKRGWYVGNPKLGGKKLKFYRNDWQVRDH